MILECFKTYFNLVNIQKFWELKFPKILFLGGGSFPCKENIWLVVYQALYTFAVGWGKLGIVRKCFGPGHTSLLGMFPTHKILLSIEQDVV